jgi:hypothetical protein
VALTTASDFVEKGTILVRFIFCQPEARGRGDLRNVGDH